MRLFSEREKKLITDLVKKKRSDSFLTKFPIDFLYRRFLDEKLLFDVRDINKPCFSLYRSEETFFTEEATKICNEFIEFAVLMRYLRDNGLIYLFCFDEQILTYPDINKKQNCDVLSDWKKEGLTGFPYPVYKEVAELLLECINSSIYITQTLVDMVNSDFKSIEERNLEEAKKQTKKASWTLRTSVATLLVAIAAMIVSIVLSKCSVTLDEKQDLFKQPIKVEDSILIRNQSDSVIPYIKEINEIVHEIRLNQKMPIKK